MALLEVTDLDAAHVFATADPAIGAEVLTYEMAEVLPYFDALAGVRSGGTTRDGWMRAARSGRGCRPPRSTRLSWTRTSAATGADELFRVLVDTPELAVVGLDDGHLDFRILMSLEQRRVRCVTVVPRHNASGDAYFAVVRPFHRRLVPYLLVRAAQRGWTPAVESGQGRHGRTHASPARGTGA